MVPNPKVEIESKENAQTKRNLEMKMQEIEPEAHRQTSPTEYKRQKTRLSGGYLSQNNIKYKNLQTQNMQEFWNTMKKTNVQVI